MRVSEEGDAFLTLEYTFGARSGEAGADIRWGDDSGPQSPVAAAEAAVLAGHQL